MPMEILNITKIKGLIYNERLSGYEISNEAGISKTVINEIRSGKRKFDNLNYKTLAKLQNYIEEKNNMKKAQLYNEIVEIAFDNGASKLAEVSGLNSTEAKDLVKDFIQDELYIYTRKGLRRMYEDMNDERQKDDIELIDVEKEIPEGSEYDVYINTIHSDHIWIIKHEDIDVFFEYYDSDEYEELEEDDVDYELFELHKQINML